MKKGRSWLPIVLWIAGAAILAFFVFGRGFILAGAALGAFYLAGGLVVALIWFIYKIGGGRRKNLPDLGEVGVSVMVAVAVGMLITLIQERVIKFPHKFSDPLFFSNVVIIIVFFLLGRASKKGENEPEP